MKKILNPNYELLILACTAYFEKPLFFYLQLCVSLCLYVHLCAGSHGNRKRTSDPLDLELQADVSCPM